MTIKLVCVCVCVCVCVIYLHFIVIFQIIVKIIYNNIIAVFKIQINVKDPFLNLFLWQLVNFR